MVCTGYENDRMSCPCSKPTKVPLIVFLRSWKVTPVIKNHPEKLKILKYYSFKFLIANNKMLQNTKMQLNQKNIKEKGLLPMCILSLQLCWCMLCVSRAVEGVGSV